MLSLYWFVLLTLMTDPVVDPVVQAKLRVDQPSLHFYEVELIFPGRPQPNRELHMAAWTPGSYKIRDYARHIEGFAAFDAQNAPLTWHKREKGVWVVEAPPQTPVTVRYRVFAYEFTVRTSFLNHQMGHVNPASVFFYEPDQPAADYALAVSLPEGWTAATGLPNVSHNAYLASSFDELADSPFLFGALRRHEFQVQNIPHAWVIAGDLNANEPEMVKAIQKAVETTSSIFGSFPFKDYTFLTSFQLDGGRGGLEHRNSTLLHGQSGRLRTLKGWDSFLSLVIHEYFHAWNVKAIRDEKLGPFDFQKENYSDLLWLHEGWTSYYDTILMGRAGFWDDKRLLKEVAKIVKNYRDKPGGKVQSLKEASFEAWTQYYQPSETTPNSQASYYDEGAISGLALDLLIRHESGGTRSLDDVMRQLYQDYAQKGQSISWAIVSQVISEVAGPSGTAFLDNHVAKPNPIPLETLLPYAGLELSWVEDSDAPEKEANHVFAPNPKVSLGASFTKRNGSVFIETVFRDQIGWKAGLDFGDELLAINNRRVKEDNLDEVLNWSRPGDEVTVLVNRSGKVLEKKLVLEALPQKLKLKLRKEPTALEKNIYTALFGEPKKPDSKESDSE